MKRAAILIALALAGCGQAKVVSVPTPVACVKRDQLPAEPASVKDDLTGNAAQDTAVLAVGLLEWKDYAGKLAALLKGCTQ